MTTGWTHLFSHRLDLAKEQFSLLPLVEGLRGLGWTAWLQSDWPALVNSWGRLLSEFPHDEANAGLLPLLAEACDDIPKDVWLSERLVSLEKRACPPLRRMISDRLPHRQDDLRWTGWGPVQFDENRPTWRSHRLQPAPIPRILELSQLDDNDGEGLLWLAACELSLQQDTTAFLACDPLEADVTVLINGQPVLRCCRPVNQHWLGLPFGTAVELSSGRSLMEVRSVTQGFGSPNCRFHWSDPEGRSLPIDSRPATRRPRSSASRDPDSPYIPQLCGRGVDSPLARAALWSRWGNSQKAKEELAELVQEYPDSPLLNRLLTSPPPSRRQFPCHRATWGQIPVGEIDDDHPVKIWANQEQDRLANLEENYPDHPWLLQDKLKLLDPWTFPPAWESLSEPQAAQACALMEKLAQRFPNGWGWDYQRLGDLHRRLGHLHRAAVCYRQAARYEPRHARPWCRLGEALLELGQGQRAERAFRAALRAEPARVAVRDQLTRCAGRPPELDDLVPRANQAPPWPTPPLRRLTLREAGFHDTCDALSTGSKVETELRQRIYPDGAVYGVVREMREVEVAGLCSFTADQDPIADTSVVNSVLYRRPPSVASAEDTSELGQGVWVVFPDCHPGDRVTAEYRLERPAAIVPGHFWQAWQGGRPADRYALVSPGSWGLFSSRPPSQRSIAGDLNVSIWDGQEPVLVSTFATWDEVVEEFRQLYQRHWLRPHRTVRSQARALTRDTPDAEQALVLYRFTRQLDQHWSRPGFSFSFQPPEETLRRGGTSLDKDLLLCALLAATGRDFELAMTLRDVEIPGPWFKRSVVLGPWASEPPRPYLCIGSGELRL